MRKALCWMMVVAVAAGLCVGCEAFKPKPPPPPPDNGDTVATPDVDGKWRVQWTVNGGGMVPDFDLRLDQDGNDLEGDANFASAAWDIEGEVEDDGEIEFRMEIGGTGYEFEGEVLSDTKMEGEWKADLGSPPASGEWEALKAD